MEFFWGIKNLIGFKCGFLLILDGLLELIDILNLDNEVGCLMLIVWFGLDKVFDYLL